MDLPILCLCVQGEGVVRTVRWDLGEGGIGRRQVRMYLLNYFVYDEASRPQAPEDLELAIAESRLNVGIELPCAPLKRLLVALVGSSGAFFYCGEVFPPDLASSRSSLLETGHLWETEGATFASSYSVEISGLPCLSPVASQPFNSFLLAGMRDDTGNWLPDLPRQLIGKVPPHGPTNLDGSVEIYSGGSDLLEWLEVVLDRPVDAGELCDIAAASLGSNALCVQVDSDRVRELEDGTEAVAQLIREAVEQGHGGRLGVKQP